MSKAIAHLETTRPAPPKWLVAPFLRPKVEELERRLAGMHYAATSDLTTLLSRERPREEANAGLRGDMHLPA